MSRQRDTHVKRYHIQTETLPTVVASGTGSWFSSILTSRVALGCHKRFLQRLVRQPVPLLHKIDPQHPLQPDRRPARLTLRVKRPQSRYQPRPGHGLLHLGQELVTPRLLLANALCFGKALCPLHQSALTQDRAYSSTTQNGFISTFVECRIVSWLESACLRLRTLCPRLTFSKNRGSVCALRYVSSLTARSL